MFMAAPRTMVTRRKLPHDESLSGGPQKAHGCALPTGSCRVAVRAHLHDPRGRRPDDPRRPRPDLRQVDAADRDDPRPGPAALHGSAAADPRHLAADADAD